MINENIAIICSHLTGRRKVRMILSEHFRKICYIDTPICALNKFKKGEIPDTILVIQAQDSFDWYTLLQITRKYPDITVIITSSPVNDQILLSLYNKSATDPDKSIFIYHIVRELISPNQDHPRKSLHTIGSELPEGDLFILENYYSNNIQPEA